MRELNFLYRRSSAVFQGHQKGLSDNPLERKALDHKLHALIQGEEREFCQEKRGKRKIKKKSKK